MRVVVESPFAGADKQERIRNLRFVAWCCRALRLQGHHPLASHLVCPMFLDEDSKDERNLGIAWAWCWIGDPHWLFEDLGWSSGMQGAWDRCASDISRKVLLLAEFAPECWAAFQRGEWPPGMLRDLFGPE